MRRISKGAEIVLSGDDQALCIDLASRRFASNRSARVRNARVGPQSDELTDREGVAGEFAFCRLAGLEPDLTIEPRSAVNDQGDVPLSGLLIDVKTTRYKTGRLLARTHLQSTGTLFVLMVGTFPSYTFAGCLPGHRLLIPENIGNLGYGPTYMVEQEDLVDILIPEKEPPT